MALAEVAGVTEDRTTKDDAEAARRRLEAALRENLRRRKAQQRGRSTADAARGAEPEEEDAP